jgi:sugar lactone lactonase YvrE
MPVRAVITSVHPLRAAEGGRVVLEGTHLPVDPLPLVTIGDAPARVVFAAPSRIVIQVPPGLEPGLAAIRVEGLTGERCFVSVAGQWAAGLHQVDSPVFDDQGHLFVTYSGSRGQEALVSIFRVTPAGTREPYSTGIVNATSMTIGPDKALYVSSRFEGAVHRVAADGSHEQIASELGVACGLAFDQEGWLYVGDRSGTVFRVRDGRAKPFATLPPSVAAFHLAMSPEQELFVSAPTLGSYDRLFRIGRTGNVQTLPTPFGRPQGLAFSPDGVLHVVDALAGASGLYRLDDLEGPPEMLVSGNALIGAAFGSSGELVVVSNDTAYRFN